MKLLMELTEKKLGISQKEEDYSLGYILRKAARAVIVDENNMVALLFDGRHNHHKIPGGGVDKGESVDEALVREVKEEAGVAIKIIDELGMTIEYRNKLKIIQMSYAWLAKVKGKKHEPGFDEEERRDGFKLKWVSWDEAFKLFKKDKPKGYSGYFMYAHDYYFLKLAKKMLK